MSIGGKTVKLGSKSVTEIASKPLIYKAFPMKRILVIYKKLI